MPSLYSNIWGLAFAVLNALIVVGKIGSLRPLRTGHTVHLVLSAVANVAFCGSERPRLCLFVLEGRLSIFAREFLATGCSNLRPQRRNHW
jgi:hypothetical protein